MTLIDTHCHLHSAHEFSPIRMPNFSGSGTQESKPSSPLEPIPVIGSALWTLVIDIPEFLSPWAGIQRTFRTSN